MCDCVALAPTVGARLTKRPTVLLADDDKALLNGARRLLESEFEVVGTVGDGESLLAAAEKLHPDVVVVDITMPGLNGFQAARRLRKSQPTVQIVFLTVHEEPIAVTEALELGAAGYVIKRSASSDLILAIREALQGRCFVSPAVQR